jgi:hypothetical protein
MSSATYLRLLRLPGAAAFFLSAAIGRIGIAMSSLGTLWLVHHQTHSYAIAGLVTGAVAVAEALAGPQLARLMDRFGQTRVLPRALLAHAISVGALLTFVMLDASAWLMTLGGVLVGSTIPQLGALSAARWSSLLTGEDSVALPTAFALESLANAVAYLAGPLLVSGIAVAGHPALSTVFAASLVVAGGLSLARQDLTAPKPSLHLASRARASRILLKPAFFLLTGTHLAIGGFFGSMQVSVTAFAVGLGTALSAAALFAASDCAGLLAGWCYGMRPWRAAPSTQLVLAAAALWSGCVLMLVVESPLWLGVCLAITGLAIPVILVLCTLLTQSSVHPAVLTEAFSWQNSASAAGSAAAAALAGRAVDALGAQGGSSRQ